jgi:hypothetical protein
MTPGALLMVASALMGDGFPLGSTQTVQQMWTPEPNIPPLGGAGGRLAIGGAIQLGR